MQITKLSEETIVNSFRNYLAINKKNAEEIFLFSDVKSFKDFLGRFEPDISEYSHIEDMQRFLKEEVFGKSIIVVYAPVNRKIAGGGVYVFNICKITDIKEKKGADIVIWGWPTEFTLIKK
ncbi:MAG: hypothetical protein PHQ01_01360 [Candidatus Pacebacteria bacterium]|nr:hypothetical protein [Candidatus Paceibacterota bacterium]